MGMTVNGTGTTGTTPVMQGKATAGRTNSPGGNGFRTKKTGASASSAQQKPKKRLNYNYREISGQLIQAKKAQGASTVLVRAKSKLAVLQRCVGTGQYNTNELTNAIAHARRMVRCARLKVNNLKEEEMEAKGHQKKSNGKKQKKEAEIRRRIAQKERELEGKLATEHLQEVMKEKAARQRMMQKRRMHRREEQGKINEADMKYIKGLMENGSDSDHKNHSGDNGVLIELSAAAAAQSEAEMLRQQIEQEVRAEVEAEMSMETGGVSGISGDMDMGTTEAAAPDAAASAEAAVSIDVAL